MTTSEIQFYLRHRRQISEWAKLERRADDLIRDAVRDHAPDKATNLLRAVSGEADVDFYVRNRALITEWDGLQAAAGQALHTALLEAAQNAQLIPSKGKKGWTSVMVRSAELGEESDEQNATVEMAWTRQDLMSTRRSYPFPRLALALPPNRWDDSTRTLLAKATRATAHELGMKKRLTWWVHWGMLDEISESQDLKTYAETCVARLQEASARLHPVLVDALSTAPDR